MAKNNFYQKILVAVNGKMSAVHTAMYGIMMARSYDLEIKFVYVVDTATLKYLAMNKLLVSDERLDFEEKLHQDGQNTLNYITNLAKAKGVDSEAELLCGGVYTEIIKAADAFNADVILIGGVDKDSLQRNVFSPDQIELLANSKIPVLVVQQPDIEKQFKIF